MTGRKRRPTVHCPFCGYRRNETLRRQMHGERWFVRCMGCGCHGPDSYESAQEAEAMWNCRSPEPLPTATVIPIQRRATVHPLRR